MCGRFVRHSSLSLIEKTFNIDSVEAEAVSSYNIAPTQPVPAIRLNRDQERKVDAIADGRVFCP